MPGVLAIGGATVALAAAMLTAQAPSAQSDAALEPLEVSIEAVNGSGCPAGTASVGVSSGNLTVTYDDYYAHVGIGSEPIDVRKHCQLSLNVTPPAGYTYAIFGVDHQGYAFLQKGSTGTVRTEYYFQGSTNGVVKSHDIKGAYRDTWAFSDDIAYDQLVWAPCDEQRLLNVSTSLRINAGTSDTRNEASILSMRNTELPGTTYDLVWKKC